MESIMEILKREECTFVMAILLIILLVAFIVMMIQFSLLKKRYQEFMKKLGKGKNIEEDLQNYMDKVEKVEKENAKMTGQINYIQQDLTKCIQKVGIFRYNAFKDTGSDLSFTLALLNEENDGVVLNGIYSREMSNIYAKPIKNGQSSYSITEEEEKAIRKAMETGAKH